MLLHSLYFRIFEICFFLYLGQSSTNEHKGISGVVVGCCIFEGSYHTTVGVGVVVVVRVVRVVEGIWVFFLGREFLRGWEGLGLVGRLVKGRFFFHKV